ncbi:MAG: thiamine pyrophosphate-binding protein [Spirochaetia bacterium]|nr:thiamine pyrophosphate-binding protein [Spirochaetia bacterium]MCE1209169.1 thiamine pyrophosphate-binding protein [Spirochaetia bacterium]
MGTVSEQLIAKFKERGMRFVFGVPSGSWLYYMEAMRKQGLDFVLVANEASAGFMADVCARLTGIPAACYGTVGPGATNLSTGVLGAYLDRSPMIALSSEPPEHMLGRTVQMAFDQQAFFRPLTKWTTRLSAERLDQIVDQAYRIALSETPGPVHIGLTEDIGGREAVSPGSSTQIPGSLSKPVPASEALLKQLEKSFNASRKPLIAVGLSAVRAKAGPLIAAIAEKHRIPVVLTPMAKGILSEDHPWYAGVLFHALSDRVAETHKQADLVIGAGYDPVEFNYEDWMPKAPLLSLDTVEADIDRSTYSGVCDIVGDITTSLGYLASLPAKSTEWDQGALEERKERMFADLAPPEGSFGPRAALAILREILPQDGIMTCDVGAHTHLIGQAWRTPEPGLQIMTNGNSSMGFGVPSAIAAKLCRPDKKVACVSGDGGFLMMAGEMALARRRRLPIVFVILADQNLELIRLKQARKNFESYSTVLYEDECPTPNYIFGVPVLRADTAEEYRKALLKGFETDGPVIVEAHIDPSEYSQLIMRKHK